MVFYARSNIMLFNLFVCRREEDMPRYHIRQCVAQKIRETYPIDIYSHQEIEPSKRTIEHVIPVRMVLSRKPQIDCRHLFVTTCPLNRFRADFAFGGTADEVLHQKEEWIHFNGCYKNMRKRLFYPKHGHRLIAHTIWNMMKTYPCLHDIGSCLFPSWDTWETWSRIAWTPKECHMRDVNDMIRRWVVKQGHL